MHLPYLGNSQDNDISWLHLFIFIEGMMDIYKYKSGIPFIYKTLKKIIYLWLAYILIKFDRASNLYDH